MFSSKRKNVYLKEEVIRLRKITTLLAVIATLGGISNLRTSYRLSKEQNKNATLTQNYKYEKAVAQYNCSKIVNLCSENEVLHDYADTAHAFALGLMPDLSENDRTCEKPNCSRCTAMNEANRIALKNYNTAIKVLGISPKTLETLRQGPQYQ